MPDIRLPPPPLLRARLRALSAARLAITLSLSGCGAQTATVDARQKATPAPESTGVAAAPPLSIPPEPPPAVIPEAGTCKEGMSLVEGNYCLTPEQLCLAHQDIPTENGKIVANQCTRYREPVTCFEDRR